MGSRSGYMILNTMAICLPRGVGSNAAPRKSTAMHASGVLWDSERDSCYVISIGCTISTCSTTHPPLIRTHLNLSPMAVTLSSHSGCRIQTGALSTLNDQLSTILQEV